MLKIKLSAAIATFNEEENIGACLESIKDIVDEIVIVDGMSTDRTVEIAKSFGAKIIVKDNPENFHINKKISFDESTGEWILYLDADERVSKKLAAEIVKVIQMSQDEIDVYQKNLKERKLFLRHQSLIEKRDGGVGTEIGEYVAFFFPRLNFFLGKFLKYGGVYPDGVIRLFKRGKAYLPARDIHEQMVVEGRVGWLANGLLHFDSPTFGRYFRRNTRYSKLIASQLKESHLQKNFGNMVNYLIFKPLFWFFLTQIRHKGILDGFQGIVFSFFSALRFPRAYLMYLEGK